MTEIAPVLSSQQQAFWTTIAQVNAAVIIALVVEIGAAARRHKTRDLIEGDLRTLVSIFLNVIALLVYLGAGAAAVAQLFLSLAVLQSGANAGNDDTLESAAWTFVAVVLVLIGPVVALVQYFLGTLAEGVIDFIAVVRILARRRKTKSAASAVESKTAPIVSPKGATAAKKSSERKQGR